MSGKERDWPMPPDIKGVWQLFFQNHDSLIFNWVEPSREPSETEKTRLLSLNEVVQIEVLAYLERSEESKFSAIWAIVTEYSPEQVQLLLEEASRFGISIPDEVINIEEMQIFPGDFRLSRLARDLIQLLGLQDERVKMRDQTSGGFNPRIHKLAEEMDLGDFEL